jgi:succinyl-CoA synthetase beta subunit
MELLKKYGVPIPHGIVAENSEEVFKALKTLGRSLNDILSLRLMLR